MPKIMLAQSIRAQVKLRNDFCLQVAYICGISLILVVPHSSLFSVRFVFSVFSNTLTFWHYILYFLSIATFVVNVGDALEAWTKGLYRARFHRVKSSPDEHRYSSPFFYGPNPKCLIEPLDSVLTRDLSYTPELLLQLPFRYGDYYHAKFQKSFDWFS